MKQVNKPTDSQSDDLCKYPYMMLIAKVNMSIWCKYKFINNSKSKVSLTFIVKIEVKKNTNL